jgi:phosphoribosylglycinamide formyltransferase-1
MTRKLDLAVFVSGSGTNMEAIARNCRNGQIDATIRVVVSNVPDAGGIERASRMGIPTLVVDHRRYPDRAAHERAVIEALAPYPIDLVVLAGYMRMVTPVLLDRFFDRANGRPGVINIHPADTRRYQGAHGYEFALGLAGGGSRLTETAVTIHFVDAGMDTGPVILRKPVPVLADDTIETLRARGLAIEYQAYSEAIQLLATDRITVADGKVDIHD